MVVRGQTIAEERSGGSTDGIHRSAMGDSLNEKELAMAYENIIYEPGTVARVIMNRPQYLNAQSRPMLEEMDDAFAKAAAFATTSADESADKSGTPQPIPTFRSLSCLP